MNKGIAIVLITSLSILCLASCDGEGGTGEGKLNVYDVFINIESVDGIDTECPGAADLKLSLLLNGNKISGFAQLFGFGKIGPESDILGVVEDGNFSLQPFGVTVFGDIPPDAQFPASGRTFDFAEFVGELIDIDENNINERIEGTVSGEIFNNNGDVIICDAEFTGGFSGEEKIPNGCVSKAELTLDVNRECPAQAISNLCNSVSYFCEIPESMPPGDFLIDNGCIAIGCFTIDCPISPEITNLQLGINGAISGNFQTSEGSGEPISCGGPN